MNKTFLYKIISSLAFLTIFALLIILFSKIQIEDKQIYYLATGIITSAILMLILNFVVISFKTDIIQIYGDEENEDTDEKEKKEIYNELDGIQKRENIKNTVFEILKNIENIEDINIFAETILRNFAKTFSIVQGIIFNKDKETDKFSPISTYAYYSNEKIREFETGEGISGQVAKNKAMLIINNIPENYITVLSGLGSSSPKQLLIAPFVYNNETIAILEIASFTNFPSEINEIFSKISEPLSEKIFNLIKN